LSKDAHKHSIKEKTIKEKREIERREKERKGEYIRLITRGALEREEEEL
jgi:hypothetical protein